MITRRLSKSLRGAVALLSLSAGRQSITAQAQAPNGGRELTIVVLDGVSGRPLGGVAVVFGAFRISPGAPLVTDRHGVVHVFLEADVEQIDLQAAGHVVPCSGTFENTFVVADVLNRGAAGQNVCGKKRVNNLKKGEITIFCRKTNWLQRRFQ